MRNLLPPRPVTARHLGIHQIAAARRRVLSRIRPVVGPTDPSARRPGGPPPAATIAIVTKNRRDDVRRALASAMRQEGDYEVLVVDDGSEDGTPDMIRAEFPEVTLECRSTSGGVCVARNHAYEIARSPIVVQIDDDSEFSSPDVVAQTLHDFEDFRFSAVGIPYIDLPVGPDLLQKAPDDDGAWVLPTFRGCAVAIRREDFLALGGYRIAVVHQGEEIDFALRMLDAGMLIRAGRADPVYHHETEVARSRTKMAVYGRRNEILLSFTLYPFPGSAIMAVGYAVKALTRSFPREFSRSTMRGIVLGVGDAWRMRRERRPISWRVFILDRRLRIAGSLPLQEVEHMVGPLTASD
jgi:glycosyltransferase involved in cell wall biosynthesis